MKCRARYARGCVNWAIKMTLKTSALLSPSLTRSGDAAKNTVAWAKTTRESNASVVVEGARGDTPVTVGRSSPVKKSLENGARLGAMMKWETIYMWRQQV